MVIVRHYKADYKRYPLNIWFLQHLTQCFLAMAFLLFLLVACALLMGSSAGSSYGARSETEFASNIDRHATRKSTNDNNSTTLRRKGRFSLLPVTMHHGEAKNARPASGLVDHPHAWNVGPRLSSEPAFFKPSYRQSSSSLVSNGNNHVPVIATFSQLSAQQRPLQLPEPWAMPRHKFGSQILTASNGGQPIYPPGSNSRLDGTDQISGRDATAYDNFVTTLRQYIPIFAIEPGNNGKIIKYFQSLLD
jgi:hypothetical protein